jgi:predicted nucleic acid-binding protein
MKYLIFDTGPIISLTMSGMLPLLEKLKGIFDGEFILTPSVKFEVVDRPSKIKKYKLESLQVQDLINKGVFKMSNKIVSDQKLDAETKRVLKTANGVIRESHGGKKVTIIHKGEASCLAFSNLCKTDNVIVVDERTTRLLTEAPRNLEKLIGRKVHTHVKANLSLLNDYKKYKFIRSSELLFIAYKKDLINIKKSKDLLDALLYSVKFNGAAISSEEIEEMKRLV